MSVVLIAPAFGPSRTDTAAPLIEAPVLLFRTCPLNENVVAELGEVGVSLLSLHANVEANATSRTMQPRLTVGIRVPHSQHCRHVDKRHAAVDIGHVSITIEARSKS
jgi:hypothetical protein